ncbi:FliH/SctL family protein [Jannaschia marina]|uniref:hypothetical protein n=1 Tax=Jannaschia marina TaxID=2741674 RepID=UPI0015CAA616|nr:hypothetical protein [Jannaschia marina]
MAMLEDFGRPLTRASAPLTAATEGQFDAGYNAGWDDAMRQVESDRAAVGSELAERLKTLSQERAAARREMIAQLEPALREIFDKVLPRAADRSFLPSLVEEIAEIARTAETTVRLLVAPENCVPVRRACAQAELSDAEVEVCSEAALGPAQAFAKWGGEERQFDLDRVLQDLDAALETFLDTLGPEQTTPDLKEAQNG